MEMTVGYFTISLLSTHVTSVIRYASSAARLLATYDGTVPPSVTLPLSTVTVIFDESILLSQYNSSTILFWMSLSDSTILPSLLPCTLYQLSKALTRIGTGKGISVLGIF